MYSKLHLSAALSILALPLLASAQIKPGPSQLVSVIDPDESPADLAKDSGWTDPHIQGFLIKQSWASLEPAEGTYNFALFDRAVELAQQNGKFVGLAVGSGRLAPDWVYTAGAHPVSLSASGGKTDKMPLPWDPIFQAEWSSLIEALGNRYDNNPAVAYVVMSGMGRDYDSFLASADEFNALEGPLFWRRTADDIADLYATSFPHTRIIYPTTPVIPGALGQKLVDSVAFEQLEAHAGQFGVETESLLSENYGQLSSTLSAAVGAVGLRIDPSANLTDIMAAAERNGLLDETSYTEVSSGGLTTEMLAERTSWSRFLRPLVASQNTNTSTPTPTPPPPPVTTAPPPASTTTTASTGSTTTPAKSTTGTVTTSSPPAVTSVTETAFRAALTAASKKAASSKQPMWLTAAASGPVGNGTQASPLNVSTAARLHAVLFPLSSTLCADLTFHFRPGTYLTGGDMHDWAVSTNWQFLGAGQGSTIIKLDPSALSYTGSRKDGDFKQVISTNGKGGILIKNMTLDANCTGMGSSLMASFVMPAPRHTVTVNVANSSAFRVGKWIYVQDSAPTAGVNLYYALMEVAAIPDATHVTLKNSEVATAGTVKGKLTAGSPVITGISSMSNLDQGQTLSGPGIPSGTAILSVGNGEVTLRANATASVTGATLNYGALFVDHSCHYCPLGNVPEGTTIPASSHLLLAVQLSGITAGRTQDTIENVTVQNVAAPFYEGPAGICMNGFNTETGGVVQNCTIKNIWGTNGWILSLTNTNGVSLIGNSIISNGYHQGLGSDSSNAIFENNTVVRCNTAFFSDVGMKTNVTVTGNTFEGLYCVNLAGAGLGRSSFSNNHLVVTRSGGHALQFTWVKLTSTIFSKNTLCVAPGVNNATGVAFSQCADSADNLFSDNLIYFDLTNFSDSAAYGKQAGNVDEDGNTVDLGLAE